MAKEKDILTAWIVENTPEYEKLSERHSYYSAHNECYIAGSLDKLIYYDEDFSIHLKRRWYRVTLRHTKDMSKHYKDGKFGVFDIPFRGYNITGWRYNFRKTTDKGEVQYSEIDDYGWGTLSKLVNDWAHSGKKRCGYYVTEIEEVDACEMSKLLDEMKSNIQKEKENTQAQNEKIHSASDFFMMARNLVYLIRGVNEVEAGTQYRSFHLPKSSFQKDCTDFSNHLCMSDFKRMEEEDKRDIHNSFLLAKKATGIDIKLNWGYDIAEYMYYTNHDVNLYWRGNVNEYTVTKETRQSRILEEIIKEQTPEDKALMDGLRYLKEYKRSLHERCLDTFNKLIEDSPDFATITTKTNLTKMWKHKDVIAGIKDVNNKGHIIFVVHRENIASISTMFDDEVECGKAVVKILINE